VSRRGAHERPKSPTRARVLSIEDDQARERPDPLASEEPLEIRLVAGGRMRTLAVRCA
jgi:FdhD protein